MPLKVNQEDQAWQYIYCRENIKFQRLAYLSGRNKYFESLGGKFECDIGDVYLVLVY